MRVKRRHPKWDPGEWFKYIRTLAPAVYSTFLTPTFVSPQATAHSCTSKPWQRIRDWTCLPAPTHHGGQSMVPAMLTKKQPLQNHGKPSGFLVFTGHSSETVVSERRRETDFQYQSEKWKSQISSSTSRSWIHHGHHGQKHRRIEVGHLLKPNGKIKNMSSSDRFPSKPTGENNKYS